MKKLLALLLAALMVLSLVACAQKPEEPAQDQPSETATVEETPSEETPAEQTPAEGEENAEKKVITYWAQWSEDETQAAVLKDAIARFETNNPEYTVQVNWAGREVRDILRASIDSGTQIDVVEGDYSNISANLGADYLMDLTPYVAGTELEASISGGMAAFAKS